MGDQRNRGEVSTACLKGLGCLREFVVIKISLKNYNFINVNCRRHILAKKLKIVFAKDRFYNL